MFYANARQNRPLRQGGKPFGLKTELELRVCKLNGLVACNSDIGIALMYHEACMKESFD
jgi:hypothetical protein